MRALEPRFVLNAAGMDLTVMSEGVVIVSREADNLEIRTADTFDNAQVAAPTICDIAGLNGNNLDIVGSADNDTLYVDIDEFIVPEPGGINFDGEIFFNGQVLNADQDRLILFDSNLATDDSFDQLTYDFNASNDSLGIAGANPIATTNLQVRLTRVEFLDQLVDADQTNIIASHRPDQFTIDDTIDPGLFQIETIINNSPGPLMTVTNPAELLSLRGFQNNDGFIINSIDNDFHAAIDIDGEEAFDNIVIPAALNLGNGSVTGNVGLRAESIDISGSIDTTGGDTDGSVTFSGESVINLSGNINTGSNAVVVTDGSLLQGDGRIESTLVVTADGLLAPSDGSNETGTLNVGALQLDPNSRFQIQLNGTTPGVDYDQIVTNADDAIDGSVVIDGALLDFSLGFTPAGNTEFVLIDNDGSDAINGRLATRIGLDGAPLLEARTLQEGDLIFDTSIGSSQPAYITYFGGDGNDVAIVTAGTATVQSQGVTIVSRNGTNLEIRTADTFPNAEMASPTIRPIAGLNGNNVRIVGTAPIDDLLFVDVDRWIDPAAINFDGGIVFIGGNGVGDQDGVTVFDSDVSTDDSAESIAYNYASSLKSGRATINLPGDEPDVFIRYTGTESFDQRIDADVVDMTLANRADTMTVDRDPRSANFTLFENSSGGSPDTHLSIPNPIELMSISGRNGDDTININGTARKFRTALDVDGSGGSDIISINTPLSLGNATTVGNVTLNAETIRVFETINTTAGVVDGSVTLEGGADIIVGPGFVFTGTAPILIDGNEGTIDTAAGTLNSANSITIRNASSVTFGEVRTPMLTLGVNRDITGPVSQAPGTSIFANTLTASTNGSIDLSQPANRFAVLDGIEANGFVAINDGTGNLQVIGVDSSGNDITISTSGTAILETVIESAGATVEINAGNAIRDFDPADTTAKIIADTVVLTAGSSIGQSGALEVDANVLSVDTSSGNGNIHITNPFGALGIDHVNAGTGIVQLAAVQLDDATDDMITDIIASRLVLEADTGIGAIRPLELLMVERLSAVTDSGRINLDWTTAGDTVAEQLIAGSDGIVLTQRGADTLEIQVLESMAGAVDILSEDGAITISAGPPVTADSLRIDANRQLSVDRSLSTTTGPLMLISAEIIQYTGELNTTAAQAAGQITLTAPLLQLTDSNATSAGADIIIDGNLTIDGDVAFDSGNQQAAAQGGNIQVTGTVQGTDSVGDRLHLEARGSNSAGDVSIDGGIGGPDINELRIHADVITVNSVSVSGGNVEMTGSSVVLTGNELQTTGSGDINIDAPLSLPSGNVDINAAGSVLLQNTVSGQATTGDVSITAGTDVIVDGAISDVDELSIAAGQTTRLLDTVTARGDITLDGGLIELFSPSIMTPGTLIFGNDVAFKANSQVDASQIRLDGAVTVDPSLTPLINGSIIDSPVAAELVKLGAGTLVLSGNSPFSQNTRVSAGTLRVTGNFGAGTGDLTVENGGRLEGDALFDADIIIHDGGSVAPGIVGAVVGETTAVLTVDSLRLDNSSKHELQINGPGAGTQYDQLIVDPNDAMDGSVALDGAILDFTLGYTPDPNTEFVIIANDGIDDVAGRFQTYVGTDGSLLPTARTLNEGDLVFDTSIGSAEPAYITYFGGDGNDVAIVVGGDVPIQSVGVTIVSRRGTNLEIRTADTFVNAQAASPTVRPIAGLNGHELQIDGLAGLHDQLFIDLDAFVVTGGLNLDGTIVFTGDDSAGDQDRIVLFDSNLSSDDSVDAITYTNLPVAGSGIINLDPQGNKPNIPIEFTGAESIDQMIDADQVLINTSAAAETLTIDQDATSTDRTQIASDFASTPGALITIENPSQQFSFLGNTGNDSISFNGIGDGFSAALSVDGGGGTDNILLDTSLALGNGVTGHVDLAAETVNILQSIDTTGGATDGNVTILGGDNITVAASISTGNGSISIDGNGGTVDTAAGTLTSNDSVLIQDASSVDIGNVQTDLLTLGIDRDITGPVVQASGTTIATNRLTASTTGSLTLAESLNEFEVLDGISAGGAITIDDSSGDLTLINIDSENNNITISTVGTATLQTPIDSVGATVEINAGDAILDFDPADTTAKITADSVILTAGAGGIGDSGAFEINANTLLADTSSGNGNVHISNPFGALGIDQVNAGTGTVQLSAVQLDDATDDTMTDITSSGLNLGADTGIGSLRPLELSAVERLSAVTDSGGINLDWTTAGNTVVEQLIAGSGGIMLTQRGAQAMDIQVLENLSGTVNIVSEDGAIDIAAGPVISSDSIRIESQRLLSVDRSIRTTNGSLALISNESLVLSGMLDTTEASIAGVINVSAPQLQFNDAQLTTSGAKIMVTGNQTIDGDVVLDSGDQQSAIQGGDITIAGTVQGADSLGDRLQLDARGTNSNGDVTIEGAIGGPDINQLQIHADAITVNSVGVTGGDISLTGSSVVLTGNELRTTTSGNIDIDAPLTLPAGNVDINAADSVFLRNTVSGLASTGNVSITAGEDVTVDGAISGLDDLLVTAGQTTRLLETVQARGDITLNGGLIEILSSSITTPGTLIFGNDVVFQAGSQLDTNQVRFDGMLTVDPLLTTTITGSIINSPVPSELAKLGTGTLLLTGNSPFTQNARVSAGTLRVTGTFGSGTANLLVETGARLEGDGGIGANVIVQDGGTFGPGNSEPGSDADAAIRADSLTLQPGSRFEVQINGPQVGIDTDQVVVDPAGRDGTVNVSGAILDASVTFIPAESTEFVIIDNDGTDDVIGRFEGAEEGRIIFGTEGQPGPRAYITYFGGDGNDVAIVTAGDLTIDGAGFTIISRRGTNLEVRTGADMAGAQTADPTIRPIGALNGQELRIGGQPVSDTLIVDVDQFVDSAPNGVNYNGTIVFSGQESGADQDQLILLDSDLSSDDSVEKITYEFSDLETGLVTLDPVGDAPNFRIQFSDLELIDQPLDAARIQITTSDLSEQIIVSESAGLIPIQSSSGGQLGTKLSIPTPSDSFAFNAGGGDDVLQVNNLVDVRSEIVIEGGDGVDELTLATPLTLGRGNITGNAALSAETLRIENSIDTTGGNIDGTVELTAGIAIEFVPGASIFSGDATITLDGNGGVLDATGGFVRSLSTGDGVIVRDASRVTLSGIETPNGTTVLGVDGDITGPVTQGPGVNLITDRLTASTSNSIDLTNNSNAIRLIDGIQSGGSIAITDGVGDLTISGIDSSENDVDILAAGIVLLDNNAINAGAANVSLEASGIDDLNPGDALPNIIAGVASLVAGADSIGQTGTVIVNASQSVSADITGANGNVRLANPQGDLLIGRIDAGSGRVELMARRIEDASNDATADIIATRLEMQADAGIGTGGAIELLSVQQVDATTESGGINLDWAATSRTVVERLSTTTGDITVRQSGGQTLELRSLENQNDDISITNQDGSIDIVGTANQADAIRSPGQGNVLIVAQGNESDMILRRGIQSNTGDTELRSDRDLTIEASGDITSPVGSIILRADERIGDHGGNVIMSDGAVVDAGVGNIDIGTDGNVTIGQLTTTDQGTRAVKVVSSSGAIIDGGDQDMDILVNDGAVTLQSDRGIGFGNRLETAIATLTSEVTGTGGTEILELDEILLQSVVTNDGLIEFTAGGVITAMDVISQNSSGSDDAMGSGDANRRDIRLITQGPPLDILIDNVTAMNSADVLLIATDDILDINCLDDRRVVADDLRVISGNDTADQDIAVELFTDVNDLEILVMRNHRGDIDINERNSVRLASSDRADDSERIETTNGEIRVFAGEAIQILDPDVTNDLLARTADPEIIAAGAHGRIEMESLDSLEIGNGAQLDAELFAIESVVLESSDFVFGEQIEINTGDGVGVARIFGPRPRVGLPDTSFFDFTSVRTNRLEQALINDAEGVFTVDIGSEGERGLTINIDWAADFERFQQIDLLSGDAPPLSVKHLYLESDILDSRLNGRASATDSFNVKFAVRHHESILLKGDTVTQDGSPVDPVAGGVISTTDNPFTFESEQVQILENGTATFIIPNLSIPVAFFPVRDVIPERVEPEAFIVGEQAIVIIQTVLETVQSTVLTSVSREEFFQIRALSPDPSGEDLAPPERLPDDILDGDKLRNFLADLPDGRYEIEYVLGDGNERSILSFDLRSGAPIISSGELDGGTLKLKLIEGKIPFEDDELEESDAAEATDDDKQEADNETNTIPDVTAVMPPDRSLVNNDTEDTSATKTAAGLAIGAVHRFRRRRRTNDNRFSAAKRTIQRMRRTSESTTGDA